MILVKSFRLKYYVIRKLRKSFKKILKNSIKRLANVNKFSTLAPALQHKRNKKEIHVRRHIELTAALTEMLRQKNKE